MNIDPPIPKPFKFKNKALQAEVEFILYNYQLRLAVGEYRKRWGTSMHRTPAYMSLPINEEVSEADAEIGEIIKIFGPNPNPNYWGLIHEYANHDRVVPFAPINPDGFDHNSQTPAFSMLMGGKEEPYVRSILDSGYMLPSFTASLMDTTSSAKMTVIEIHEPLSPAEWTSLKKVVKALDKQLPKKVRKENQGSNIIQMLSKISDLKRSKKKPREIAALMKSLDLPQLDEDTIRQYLRRAKNNCMIL